jgi:hypothetical protein
LIFALVIPVLPASIFSSTAMGLLATTFLAPTRDLLPGIGKIPTINGSHVFGAPAFAFKKEPLLRYSLVVNQSAAAE